jgi:hypothetical protein
MATVHLLPPPLEKGKRQRGLDSTPFQTRTPPSPRYRRYAIEGANRAPDQGNAQSRYEPAPRRLVSSLAGVLPLNRLHLGSGVERCDAGDGEAGSGKPHGQLLAGAG